MRLWLTVGILLGVAAIGGGGLWWLFLSSFGDRQWQDTRQRLERQGYTLDYGAVERGGFPFRLEWVLHDVSLSFPGEEGGVPPFRGEAERVRVQSRPWQPQRMAFTVEGRHRWAVETRGAAGVVDIAVGAAEGVIGPRAEASGWRLESALQAITAHPRQAAAGGDLRVDRATVMAETPLRMDELAVDARLQQIGLPHDFGLGTVVEQLTLRGNVKPLPEDLSPNGLQAWQAAGGVVSLADAQLLFGPLDGGAEGRLGLNDQLRLQGDVTVRVRQPNEVLALAARNGWISDRQQPMFAMGFGLFTRRNDAGQAEATLPFAFRDGAVWLGPVRLAAVPPVAEALAP